LVIFIGDKMAYESYRKLVHILKEECPLAFPISVRRMKIADDGDCCLYNKKFYIRINNDLAEQSSIDTLLHEFAHARAWNHLHDSQGAEEFEEKIHDAFWGVAYSEVYRIYEKHIEEL